MNRLTALCASLLLLFTGQVAAADTADYGFYGGFPTGRFKPLAVSKDRAVYESALRYRIMVLKANQQNNHFCMIGYHWPKRKDDVTLIWYEHRRLYFLWSLDNYDAQDVYKSLIYTSSTGWDGLWTYLQGRAHDWEIMSNKEFYNAYDTMEDYLLMQLDCERNGEMITIPAFPRPKNCPPDDPPDEPYNAQKEQLCDAIKLSDRNY